MLTNFGMLILLIAYCTALGVAFWLPWPWSLYTEGGLVAAMLVFIWRQFR